MKKRSGFTLIELSIVLIIIGLIIGAVMKGRDLINSADQKKIYNTWVKQWQVSANEYEDRTGGILGDGKVNGDASGTPDGKMDSIDLVKTGTVQDILEAVGLDIPSSNVATADNVGKGASYQMKGKYTTSTSTMALGNNIDGNYIKISNMPTDIAIAFDKMTDGTLDPQLGDFVYDGTKTAWPNASSTKVVNVRLKVN